MPLQKTAHLKNNPAHETGDKFAAAFGVAFVLLIIACFGTLYWLFKQRQNSFEGRPTLQGIARVENAIVTGKSPIQTIFLRFNGQSYTVTYSTIHDVAVGKDAVITYRAALSGDIVIDNVERVQPKRMRN
jgi:hypothetical protein